MQEQKNPESDTNNKKWLPDDLDAVYDKAEKTFGPESPDYLLASASLKIFAKKLGARNELPNPRDFTDLESFLKSIAQQVGDYLPFESKGIGENTVANQALIVGGFDDLDTLSAALRSYHVKEVDCKLPTSALGYVLNWYFHTNNWPLEAGLVTQSRNAHVYVAVRPKESATQEQLTKLSQLISFSSDDYIFFDYIPIKGMAFAGKSTHQIKSVDVLIAGKRCTYDTSLGEGLIEYDKRYLEAVAEQDANQ